MEGGACVAASLASLEAACAAFATSASAEAERALLALRAQPLAACRALLLGAYASPSTSDAACFQCAAALKEALLREWRSLPAEARASLLCEALQLLLLPGAAARGWPSAACRTLGAAAAAALKLAWAADDATLHKTRDAAAARLRACAAPGGAPREVQCAALYCLRCLVGEAAVSGASAAGMPYEAHRATHLLFEREALQACYAAGAAAAREEGAYAAGGVGQDAGARAAAQAAAAEGARLAAAALGWDFGARRGARGATLGAHANAPCKPGVAWRGLLLAPGQAAWAAELYMRLRSSAGRAAAATPLGDALNELTLRQLCVCGDIFLSEDSHRAYLAAHVLPVLAWLLPPEEAAAAAAAGQRGAEEELGAAVLCTAAIARQCGCSGAAVDAVLGAAVPGAAQTPLAAMAAMAVACARQGGADWEREDWTTQCASSLLETLGNLASPSPLMYLGGGGPTLGAGCAPSAAARAAARLAYDGFVTASLALAAAGAEEDEDVHEGAAARVEARDDLLGAAALAGRADAGAACARLLHEMAPRAQAAQMGSASAACLEELHMLCLLAGHLLADEAVGASELPGAPAGVAQAVTAGDEGAQAISALPGLAANLAAAAAGREAGGSGCAALSPRLVEGLLWFCARWSTTYLCADSGELGIDPARAAPLVAACGAPAVEALAASTAVALACFPGESGVHAAVCGALMPALARRPAARSALARCSAWRTLAEGYAAGQMLELPIAGASQRKLCAALVRAASNGVGGSGETLDVGTYTSALLAPVVAALKAQAALCRPGMGGDRPAQLPPAMERCSRALEALRGAGRSAAPGPSQVAAFGAFAAAAEPLLALLAEHRKAQPQMTSLLLKTIEETVDAHASSLEPPQLEQLVRFVQETLKAYVGGEARKEHCSASGESGRLLAETNAEAYRELKSLLRTLSHLSARDLAGGGEACAGVANTVFFGINMLLPRISAELLAFPKLCAAYFTLLSFAFEVYPTHAAALPLECFAALAGTLKFGLFNASREVAHASLQAVAALAGVQCAARGAAGASLPPNAGPPQPLPPAMTAEGRPLLAHFLRALVTRLLGGARAAARGAVAGSAEAERDFAESASDAMLALIVAEPGEYQALAGELAARAPSEAGRQRVAVATQALTSANGVDGSLSRATKRAFGRNLKAWLIELHAAEVTI